ncbi:MAG: Spy/CpxP family protein refolding chaperone [Steroidobacter sp.]
MKYHTCIAILGLPLLPTVSPGASAYAGQEGRDIKALSADEVNAYLSGEGMGLARAAELNGYPGPKHVLELSGELELSPEQRERTESLFTSMQAKSIALGRALIDEERKLDRLFAGKSATPDRLSAALARIGNLQARLRGAHLEAHLDQSRILTPEQIERYDQVRGYASGGDDADHRRHTHP